MGCSGNIKKRGEIETEYQLIVTQTNVMWIYYVKAKIGYTQNSKYILCDDRDCRVYCEICRKYKMKFGGSTCFSQIISLTKQKQNLNINHCRLFNAKSIFMQIVLFQTIQFSMSAQFNCQKKFYFKLLSNLCLIKKKTL